MDSEQAGDAVQKRFRGVIYFRNYCPGRVHLVWTRERNVVELSLQLGHALQSRGFVRRGSRVRSFHRTRRPGRGKLTWTELDFHTIYSFFWALRLLLVPISTHKVHRQAAAKL